MTAIQYGHNPPTYSMQIIWTKKRTVVIEVVLPSHGNQILVFIYMIE